MTRTNFTLASPQHGTAQGSRRPVRPAEPAGRTLHLVDAENLCGGTCFTELDMREINRAYRELVRVDLTDHVIVASSHRTAPAVWFGWQNARYRAKSGPDGADLALLAVIETENIMGRYDRVVIASGDKIFAPAAAALQAAGIDVLVVSRPESISRQLRLAAREIRYLEVQPEPETARARGVA